ncbi:hypothetical protein Arub01_19930 [Actinomadura rubrobrunea]|uniref:Uncharacterized protein n=1 Tax=Actinomadura rubrobrunea TaxID=115335 RepID=A0A9W6PSI5_9ACTN|nr:hypothetical protein Arub01_19930 [Actinomadura rubrobrunea]
MTTSTVRPVDGAAGRGASGSSAARPRVPGRGVRPVGGQRVAGGEDLAEGPGTTDAANEAPMYRRRPVYGAGTDWPGLERLPPAPAAPRPGSDSSAPRSLLSNRFNGIP